MVSPNVGSAKIVALVGSTATGKTGMSLELANRFPVEIINCDASQFYVGMDVGTAKPTALEFSQVPHHLYDIRPPEKPLDAGAYLPLADAAIADIRSRDRLPLLVGGTGLYLRALLHGLAEIPAVSQVIRERVRIELEANGIQFLQRRLSEVDPEAAQRIARNDVQRTSRALEVFYETGRPISSFQKEHGFASGRYRAQVLGLSLSDTALRNRITSRIDIMLDGRFQREVALLLASGKDFSLRTLKALGYQDVAEHLAGRMSFQELRQRLVNSHWQYARRQRTWFRKMPGVLWIQPNEVDKAAALLEKWICT